GVLDGLNRIIKSCDGLRRSVINALPCHAQTRAAKAVGIEERCVIRGKNRPALALLGHKRGTGGIASLPAEWHADGVLIARVSIAGNDESEGRRCVGNRAAVRSDCVLVVRDGNDTAAAGQPDGGLNSDYAVHIRWANDAAISF